MMNINLPNGRYILAVSGGVDSMVLLHILVHHHQVTGYRLQVTDKEQKNSNRQPLTSNLELVVAHFNHGIRADSAEDEKLVAQAARKYNLLLEVGHGYLGPKTSEDQARKARYAFLEPLMQKYDAKAIITAHHQDDLIETAFINIIRGTGRQGLSSIRSSKIYRPLLDVSKKDILQYAKKNKIAWREDTTNSDTSILRNYIRQKITKKMDAEKRQKIISNLDKVAKINKIIDHEIATLSQNKEMLDRHKFIMLPSKISDELLIHWLKKNNLRDFDRKSIGRLSTAIKTAKPGTKHKVSKNRSIVLAINTAKLQ